MTAEGTKEATSTVVETRAAAAAAAVARKVVRLSEDELLVKHYPRYFYDKKEKIFPVDLNKYAEDKSSVDGCNGVATTSKDEKHTWLIYMNYYLEDGGVAVLGGTGGHKYDLEVVIVEVDIATQRITGVFYGPHSSYEHMWIRNKDDLEQIIGNTDRPKVFISLGKHASYPISGKILRLFGVGTDKCENPMAKDRPLILLNKSTRELTRIDGVFSGPKSKISRDWSTAPGTRLKNVSKRRVVPTPAQVGNEVRKTVSKLKFW